MIAMAGGSRPRWAAGAVVLAVVLAAGCAAKAAVPNVSRDERRAVISRARVWQPTTVAAMNLRTGPTGAGAFAPGAVVECRYVDEEMDGHTPKFTCVLPGGDKVKVKYGRDNGEVFAEVAATRLLWALGFGADRMYPVRVRCHGCPADDETPTRTAPAPIRTYDYAVIERKMAGYELAGPEGEGWTWSELDVIDPTRGASIAERDALKLLAAVLQHTDSKREQQRLICLDARPPAACRRPFMLINDLGKTFGKANAFNRDRPGSVNFEAWSREPVWTAAPDCHANLERSFTGSLENPAISEAGRRFLADRLGQLTDRQLRDLFTAARFPERIIGEPDEDPAPDVRAWVQAFKDKMKQITDRSCQPARSAR